MKSCVFLAALLLTVWTAVQAETVSHLYRKLIACQTNNTKTEDESELDQDELFYIDFDKKEAVQRLPRFSEHWGVGPDTIAQAEANRQICIQNVAASAQCHEYPPEKQVPPRASVYTENHLELGKPNTLICFIDGFHPAVIKVSWTKNTLPVTEGVTQTDFYSNKDFTFRMFSYLSFTPELGDVYSCQVQHSALPETLTTFWEGGECQRRDVSLWEKINKQGPLPPSSPGVAGTASSGVAGSALPRVAGTASPGVAASLIHLVSQEIRWPEPHKRELLATEKGGGGHETTTTTDSQAVARIALAGGAGLCAVCLATTAFGVGGGPPTVAATLGSLLPLFLGWDSKQGLWGLWGRNGGRKEPREEATAAPILQASDRGGDRLDREKQGGPRVTSAQQLQAVLKRCPAPLLARLLSSLAPKGEEPKRPTPEWEEPERPTPEWEEPERPTPEWEEPERPTPEWEEPEHPTPEWEEPEHPTPEWEEPEHPTPEWEEPEHPTPEWEEPEHPTPEWEEPEHPTPEWEEPERPTPEWEEPEHPTPEWEEPEHPTPEWEEPEHPTPEWEEPEHPTPEWEEPEHPTPEWEEPEHPTPEWEEPEHPTPEWDTSRGRMPAVPMSTSRV
ncbi:UNVERIFIED_CONTAM: hypothetical protein FKN15_036353 [Acipenser sinensis]